MAETASGDKFGLATKYRPQKLSDVVGQEVLTRTITNMVRLGRMAKAYVLVGSRGTGKTSTARILAKIFNCTQRAAGSVEPCLTCPSCQAIANGCHPDVIEIDAGSNSSVEAVRNFIELAQTVPTSGKMRVFIFDEFHMMSSSAFNALLHTIEEPPPRAKFIFATTEVQKIPETVLSRCLRFDLVRIDDQTMAERLAKIAQLEKIDCEEGVISLLAEAAAGSLRDALFLLEHATLFAAGQKVTFEIVEKLTGRVSDKSWQVIMTTLRSGKVTSLLAQVQDLAKRYSDLQLLLLSFAKYLHQLHLKALVKCDQAEESYLFSLLEIVNSQRGLLRESPFQREALEMIFIRLLAASPNFSAAQKSLDK